MDTGDSLLPDSINPNNFPAKLWRLVNNPTNKSICWDSHGEAIVIHQQLFERQILAPRSITSDSSDAFKTTNFSSFVRQLNLYGFRKAEPVKDSGRCAGCIGVYHHFYNPNFRRNHPELVASMRRLTVDNKAKLQAGLSVNSRRPSRYDRLSGADEDRNRYAHKGITSLLSPKHQGSAHPYCPADTGTPVPPRYLMRGHTAAGSPSVLATDKLIQMPFNQNYPEVTSNSSVVHIQPGLLASANHGNPNFTTSNLHNAQYRPGFYSPLCQCYYQNLVPSHMTASGLHTRVFSPQNYYHAGYPVNLWSREEHSHDPQKKENQEVKKCDVNLDVIFQIADEVMQTPPSNCLVKAVTPEKLYSNTSNKTTWQHTSTETENPSCATPIIINVSGSVDLVKCRQEEESVVAVPEHMPEDAITEVTSDEAKNSEVISDKVSNTHKDPSQA